MSVRPDLAATDVIVGIVTRRQNIDRHLGQAGIGLDSGAQVIAAAGAKNDIGKHEVRPSVSLDHGKRLVYRPGEGQLVARAAHHHGKCPLNRPTVVRDQDAFAHQYLPRV
jgi:hypothetical protein